jgi:probable F420-dependent oxidoreductase
MASSSARPLKVGLLLPDTQGQVNGRDPRWRDIAAIARTAEDVGFDSIWVTDHFIQRSPDGTRGPWECWSLLSALAAITERVEIGTLVLCTGFRNPAMLAKMADTVEEISDGRLILGLGAGWSEPEYLAFGYPFDHRVDRFEEAIQIITSLLRTGHADFDGTYYQANDCELVPRGPRADGPPIIVGTTSPRMMRLTAKYADGWNVWFKEIDNKVDNLVELMKKLDEACFDVGRDPSTLERSAAVKVEVSEHVRSTMSTEPIKGSPEEIAAALRAYADVGLSHIQVWPEPCTVQGVQECGKILEALDRG